MAIPQRRIDLQFRLGTGQFGEDDSNTVTLTGLRTSANITKAGGVSMSQLDLRVWGASLDVMNKLTILNKLRYTDSRFNEVTVSAGDTESGVAVCFTGIISEAWADLRSAPEGIFHVSAFTGLMEAVRPVKPVSFNGTVDAATVLAGIAAQCQPPLTLQNNGVSVQIADPYVPGTALDQIRAVAKAGNFNAVIDDGQVLAIWPAGGVRGPRTNTDTPSAGTLVPLLSPATGMVGYPQFTQNGISVTCLYNPSLTFGQTVEVKSDLTPANGQWVVAAVAHNLDAEMPGGQWFTRIECGLLGQTVGIVQ